MRWAGACCTYGRQEMCVREFWWGNSRERDRFGCVGIDGKIKLKWTFENWDWTGLGQGRDRWRARVNGRMNLRVS